VPGFKKVLCFFWLPVLDSFGMYGFMIPKEDQGVTCIIGRFIHALIHVKYDTFSVFKIGRMGCGVLFSFMYVRFYDKPEKPAMARGWRNRGFMRGIIGYKGDGTACPTVE
jgi:hypothetical protein